MEKINSRCAIAVPVVNGRFNLINIQSMKKSPHLTISKLPDSSKGFRLFFFFRLAPELFYVS